MDDDAILNYAKKGTTADKVHVLLLEPHYVKAFVTKNRFSVFLKVDLLKTMKDTDPDMYKEYLETLITEVTLTLTLTLTLTP